MTQNNTKITEVRSDFDSNRALGSTEIDGSSDPFVEGVAGARSIPAQLGAHGAEAFGVHSAA